MLATSLSQRAQPAHLCVPAWCLQFHRVPENGPGVSEQCQFKLSVRACSMFLNYKIVLFLAQYFHSHVIFEQQTLNWLFSRKLIIAVKLVHGMRWNPLLLAWAAMNSDSQNHCQGWSIESWRPSAACLYPGIYLSTTEICVCICVDLGAVGLL